MQINFRVWDSAQKVMVYFNFADIRTEKFLYRSHQQYVWPLNLDNVFQKATQITETENPIMRGSGLNDINGEEIFEGDIIKAGEIKFEVIYFDGAFWAESLSGDNIGETTLLFVFEGEIIGNIYESP